MPKESPEAIDYIFKLAMDVYTKKENKGNAIAKINKIHGTNIGSCDMYIGIIFCMLSGTVYKRAMSADATDNILKNIFALTNHEYSKNALTALKKHIIYYENKYNTKTYKLRVQLEKWSSNFENISDNEKEIPNNFKSQNDDLYSDINEINNNNDLTNTEKNTLIKARIGQGEFRRNVVQTWGLGESCPVTKISTRELLVASHIKPWRECKTKDERLDGANGILLCSNIDKLFDSHLISFKKTNNDYKICFNNKLNEQELNGIGITKSLQLDTGKIDHENRERLRIFLEGHFFIFSQKNK